LEEEKYVKCVPHPLNDPEELDPTYVSERENQQTHSSDGKVLESLED